MSNQSTARVLHVIHRMRPGGTQTAVMNLYRHVDRSQVQFDFAVRSQQSEYYDDEIRDLGGQVLHLPWQNGNPISLIAYKKALKKLILKSSYTAIHSHVGFYSGHILPIADQLNVPLRLAHSHSASLENSSIFRTIWAIFMRKSIMQYATHMLACSNLAGSWMYGAHWEADKRAMKFPNALDLSQYATLGNDRLKWRQALSLPYKGPLIGHIGRFDEVKNHPFLLKFFAAFHEIYPGAHLILVGEGPLKQQIEMSVKSQGLSESVSFLGVRGDIPQILGALDLLLLPSFYEGFGIVLIEAQAAGTPCLASDMISQETDIGLNQIRFLSLASSIQTWITQAKSLLTCVPSPWETRRLALQNAGLDIQSTARLLQKIYLSDDQGAHR